MQVNQTQERRVDRLKPGGMVELAMIYRTIMELIKKAAKSGRCLQARLIYLSAVAISAE